MFKSLYNQLFSKSNLSQEAFLAYFHRLPEGIKVEWKRDGNFIIGWVQAGDYKFVTQARSPSEFIDMINNSILVVFEIPQNYFRALRETKTFLPPEEELQKLQDYSVSGSMITLKKNIKATVLA